MTVTSFDERDAPGTGSAVASHGDAMALPPLAANHRRVKCEPLSRVAVSHVDVLDGGCAHDAPVGTPRKTYILLCIEDGEPTLVEPFYTLGDAAAKFRAIIRDDPDYVEDEVGQGPNFLPRTVASAQNSVRDTVLIVERAI